MRVKSARLAAMRSSRSFSQRRIAVTLGERPSLRRSPARWRLQLRAEGCEGLRWPRPLRHPGYLPPVRRRGSSASARRVRFQCAACGLVAVGVASAVVDGAEDGGGIVCLHEGAGAVVDGLAGDGGVVSVHDAVDEAEEHPLRDQVCLAGDHGIEQSAIWVARRCAA